MPINNLALFDFNSQSVRIITIEDEPWFIAIDVCRILEIKNTSDALKNLDEDETKDFDYQFLLTIGLNYNSNTSGLLAISESGFYKLVIRSRKPQAKPFQQWVAREVLPSIRKTGKYESVKESLENSLMPKATIKEIDEVAIAYGKRFGKLYEQRYFQQQIKKHLPQLAGENPLQSEYESLPSAKSWLTPTQLASELGLKYSTGSPNAKLVNKLLESLGYQTKVAGAWSATEKAINGNLCDRKPVDTNSRSQKDQLFWSEDIIAVLSEHAVVD